MSTFWVRMTGLDGLGFASYRADTVETGVRQMPTGHLHLECSRPVTGTKKEGAVK